MDGQRFDELARRLGTGTSRRGVLKGIAAGLGASVFGFALRAPARAGFQQCNDLTPCPDGQECVEGMCQPIGGCGEGPACDTGCSCVDGSCQPDEPICSDVGGECASHEDCCGELFCNPETSLCTTVAECSTEGFGCDGEHPCCNGLVCDSGTCIAEPTCAAYNEECWFPEVTVAASLDGSNCCEGYCLEGICVPNCIGQGGDCKSND